MAGQPRVECETCLPMKQLRDANLVANFVAILLNIIRAAVFFGNFAAPPLPHGMGISSRHRSKETFFMVNYDLCENDFLKLAHATHVLQILLLGASPVEPPSNLNVNKVLMLPVKQTAAGFNASREISQPSRNATLYDIDMPILSQLGIWFSNIFNDWEGNYCSWSNFVSLLVCPAPFALCSFPAFIPRGKNKPDWKRWLIVSSRLFFWKIVYLGDGRCYF